MTTKRLTKRDYLEEAFRRFCLAVAGERPVEGTGGYNNAFTIGCTRPDGTPVAVTLFLQGKGEGSAKFYQIETTMGQQPFGDNWLKADQMLAALNFALYALEFPRDRMLELA